MSDNNKEPAFTIKSRDKERENIAEKINAFLAKGGKIEVLSSAFDRAVNPKCRVSDEMSFFR